MSDYKDLNRKRVARIQEVGNILNLLAYFGYDVRPEYHTEQQYSCDLHGDGSDNKPSARVYPDTNSTYCWACGEARDLVRMYMAKTGESFAKACYALEEEYGLEHLYYDTPQEPAPADLEKYRYRSFTEAKHAVSDLIRDSYRIDCSGFRSPYFTPAEYFRFWEAFDMICWQHREEVWDEKKAKTMLSKLQSKFLSAQSDRACSS